ncbi:MAG TPA: ATP-binding protein, partial [Gammaproteobacteria bacterium]|nr:ATP-binding protein [Gammaproteobacteria bacterium]
IDDGLADRVEGIRRFVDDHKTRLTLDEVREEFHAHGELFQVLDDRGQVVHRGDAFPAAVQAGAPVPAERLFEATVDGEPLRVMSRRVPIGDTSYTIEAAASLRSLRAGLREAAWRLAPAVPLALLAAAGAGYWVSRRALAPVDRITQTARLIGADNLSQRLHVAASGDELERLAQTLNEMIARLEDAFQRITRFTADASHELRTPLALMRTTAEVALRAPPAAGEERAALEQIVAEIERTSQIVENLLLIARADAGVAELRKQAVNAVDAVRDACSEAAMLARVKGLTLEAQLPNEPLAVHGDGDALRRLFLILLDNAVKYTPAPGTIVVSIGREQGAVRAAVRDTGVGIAAEHLPHVFERFYRVDRARSRAEGGAGLGLAIGRWIAEAHGGSLRAERVERRGSTFYVELPAA